MMPLQEEKLAFPGLQCEPPQGLASPETDGLGCRPVTSPHGRRRGLTFCVFLVVLSVARHHRR